MATTTSVAQREPTRLVAALAGAPAALVGILGAFGVVELTKGQVAAIGIGYAFFLGLLGEILRLIVSSPKTADELKEAAVLAEQKARDAQTEAAILEAKHESLLNSDIKGASAVIAQLASPPIAKELAPLVAGQVAEQMRATLQSASAPLGSGQRIIDPFTTNSSGSNITVTMGGPPTSAMPPVVADDDPLKGIRVGSVVRISKSSPESPGVQGSVIGLGEPAVNQRPKDMVLVRHLSGPKEVWVPLDLVELWPPVVGVTDTTSRAGVGFVGSP